jgi:hypothetical protein
MPAGIATTPLNLGGTRTFGDLLADTVGLFTRHGTVFWSVTFLVVGPAVLLIDGVWGEQFENGVGAEGPAAYSLVSIAAFLVVIPPIVTAMHVRVVQRLADGVRPTILGAIREALGRLVPAVVTVALYVASVAVGLALLVAPGIWFAVRYYFGAQAAVVDALGPVAALRRSGHVVGPEWGRCFGYLLGSSFVLWLLTAIVSIPLAAIADALFGAPGQVVASAVAQSAGTSLTALFGTLLFFELRASRDPLA